MKKLSLIFSLTAVLALPLFAAQEPLVLPHIERSPKAADFSWICPEILQKGQPDKITAPHTLDVRSCDISAWDFRQYTAQELADILTFDSKTKFPVKNKLPKGFSVKKIFQNGKKPGLGVAALHKQGITGKNVSVAIIDQNLLVTHQEYKNQLVWYEEDPWWQQAEDSSMHASAVASILAGKTVGVAPQVNLFLFAPSFGKSDENQYDAGPIAHMLRRVAELNRQLPAAQKIRVVSISRGFGPHDLAAAEFAAAQKALEDDGVAVFTTNDVFTLSRAHSLAAPDKLPYCRPAYWFDKSKLPLYSQITDITVPTDFRVLASPTGNKDYVHYANGGLSWAVPYVAGLYALSVQVKPDLTKAEFIQAVAATNQTQNCVWQEVKFTSLLVNPQKLIQYLQAKAGAR